MPVKFALRGTIELLHNSSKDSWIMKIIYLIEVINKNDTSDALAKK